MNESGGDYKAAELYINLNNSEIDDAELDVYGLTDVDLYTQGTATSFIQLDVDLWEDVGTLNVYSLGNSNFDYQINYSTTNNYDEYDYGNIEQAETIINLALDRNSGTGNYDYLDIENFEMAQVNNFETAAGRDMIYNNGAFQVLEFAYTTGNVTGDDAESYSEPDMSGGLSTDADDYYFAGSTTLADLILTLTNDDTSSDGGGNAYDSLGDQIDNSNGNGNTYYVINAGTDGNEVQIYRWNQYESIASDYLSHVMTINDMNILDSVNTASEFAAYITSNPYQNSAVM
jgi:hypothetical protein